MKVDKRRFPLNIEDDFIPNVSRESINLEERALTQNDDEQENIEDLLDYHDSEDHLHKMDLRGETEHHSTGKGMKI